MCSIYDWTFSRAIISASEEVKKKKKKDSDIIFWSNPLEKGKSCVFTPTKVLLRSP